MKRWIPLFLSILLIVLATIGFNMAAERSLKAGMVAMAILSGIGGWYAGEFRASLRRKR